MITNFKSDYVHYILFLHVENASTAKRKLYKATLTNVILLVTLKY